MAHDHAHGSSSYLADMLDLDGEVLHSYWTDALQLVQAAAGPGVVRVLDLGAGTGVGTIALAKLFDGAEVLAVDVSAEMLGRIRGKALELGLADRIRTVEADLDAAWPALGTVEVSWASMSMHHFADPDRVLSDVFAATRAGGVVALAEFSEPLRCLPDDLGIGRPGLETRCIELWRSEHAHALPHLGSHWAPRLETAGFTAQAEREFAIDVAGSSPAVRRYAQLWLQEVRSGLAERLDEDDRAAVTRLIDGPVSVLRRDDLHIRGTRTVTVARRA